VVRITTLYSGGRVKKVRSEKRVLRARRLVSCLRLQWYKALVEKWGPLEEKEKRGKREFPRYMSQADGTWAPRGAAGKGKTQPQRHEKGGAQTIIDRTIQPSSLAVLVPVL